MPGNQTSHIPGKQLEHRGTFAYLKANLAVNEGGWCIDDNLLYVKNAAGKLVPHSKVVKISVGTAYSTIVRYAYGNADCAGGVLPVIEGTENSAYRYLYPEKFDPQGAFRFSAVCNGKYYWAECSSASQWTTGEQAVDTAYAVYGVTSYADVMAMLDGGTDTTGAKSKEMPLVCVLKYDTPIPYAGSGTYAPLTRGTTMPFTGIDSDGIHFGCSIAHSAGGTMPPLTIFVEALLNSQSVWSIKLRNSFQITGIDSGSGAAVMNIMPGMSTTAILQLDNATAANSKAYMLLPMTTVSQGLPRISNMMFLGFDTSSGMTPGVKTLIRFAGTTFAGVNYPIQTPMMSVYTSNTSADAGLSSIDISVYKDESDLFGLSLRIGTEFLAIADPYDRTKQYAVGDYCITSEGLYRLKTLYAPPANFDRSKWEKKTLIELITDIASHALQSVATDTTLTGDGTSAHPLSVVGGGGGGGTTYTAGNGIDLTNDVISAKLGRGLGFNSQGQMQTLLYDAGALTDAATIDVTNNATQQLTSSQAALTLNVNCEGTEVPNFAVEISASAAITLTLTKTVNNVATTLYPSEAGGTSLESGKYYQLTCVGNCWTLAEFTNPNAQRSIDTLDTRKISDLSEGSSSEGDDGEDILQEDRGSDER
jgi:hypothetical protein